MKHTTLVGLGLTVLIAIAMAAPGIVGKEDPRPVTVRNITEARFAQEVYDICQRTRLTNESEASCAEAQNKYQAIYLCKQRNALPSNECTVVLP
jgi:hypothetical protein